MSDSTRTPILPVYRIGLIAWALLLLLQCFWHGWLFPPQQLSRWWVLAFTTVPLLLPLLALHDVRRALLWVGILSLFYFCHGVAEAWSSPDERALALAEIVLTVGLIAMLGAGVKRRPASPG
ncbi:MAG TPA: DUF2069 domain-containing protein [Rhodanobacter sp.]|nr:DUF2069 domain-containing protein [Rhodanobacter sp.]